MEHVVSSFGDSYADVAVIGAGASGLMAANAAAAQKPAGVVIFERNGRAGRKLSITGKGRCNITNNAEKEQFMRNIPGNGNFLFSAFSKMSNRDIVSFFERNGVGVTLERGDRFFTKSGSAREVTDMLVGMAEDRGVNIVFNARVASVKPAISADADVLRRFEIKLADGRIFFARSVILATGGITYPSTGSTGDGYRFAEGFGHSISQPRPSLVPLETVETWPYGLTGLSLKNVTLKLYSPDGGKVFSKLGEMLFTHFGVSGPLVLSGSRALLDYGFKGCTAKIDLKPGLSDEKLRARIARDFQLYSKKSLRNAMADLLPARLIPVVIAEAGLVPETRADTVGKAGAAKLSEVLKGLKLTIKAPRPASEAIVTAGGVRTAEINPSTMESKLTPGLYFCGELIDVDAYTGGFNLSIAFATGHVAGTSARSRVS